MKKTLLTLLAIAITGFTATAQKDHAYVTGKYTGDLIINLYEPITPESEATPGQEVEIIANAAAETVDIALYNFNFGGMELGDIVLPGITFSEAADGSFVFGKKDPIEVELGKDKDGNTMIYASAGLNAETSYVKGDELFAELNVVWHAGEAGGEVPIYVQFRGTRPTPAVISAVQVANKAQGIYTLSGIRLNTLDGAAKGIYIKNGKKVVVK